MKYLQSILPFRQSSHDTINVKDIRERTIQYILLATAVVGTFALVGNLPSAITHREWLLATLYLTAYLVILALLLIRRIPYTIRALTIVAIYYLLGLFGLLGSGLGGDGRVLFITAVLLTAVLLGNTAGFLALCVTIISLAVVGFGMTTGRIALPPATILANSGDPSDWFRRTVVLVAALSLALIPFLMLVNGLETSLKKQNSLAQTLENQSSELEKSVAQRTLDLEYRLGQLRTAAEISRLISNNLDPQSVMEQMVNLLSDRFNLYYAGIFLLDETGENAFLRAGTGEAGQQMIKQNHHLAVGGVSMIGWSISNRNARIALDVGVEAIRFNNPLLPLTRSEIALPLMSRGQAIGALSLQSSQPEAFDADDISTLQGISDTFASALDNARLFQATQANYNEIKQLHQKYLEQAWSQSIQTGGNLAFSYEGNNLQIDDGVTNPIKVPLILRDQVIGQVTVDLGKDAITPDESILLEALVTQTAQALENARLLETTQLQVSQEQLLNRVSASFSSAFEIEDILKKAAQELGQLPNVTEVSVILNPPEIIGATPLTDVADRNN